MQRAVANFVLGGNTNGGEGDEPSFSKRTTDLIELVRGGDKAVSIMKPLKAIGLS